MTLNRYKLNSPEFKKLKNCYYNNIAMNFLVVFFLLTNLNGVMGKLTNLLSFI